MSGFSLRSEPDLRIMKTLRRYDIRDRFYFIVVVTNERKPILAGSEQLFWSCWKFPQPEAWVILPDHFHMIVKVEDISISDIMHNFKITFSRYLRDKFDLKGKVWQNRFWDHIIRNQDEMNLYTDYIHYNPVKHKLAVDPFTYQYSSLNLYYENGLYARDWGVKEKIIFDGEFGE